MLQDALVEALEPGGEQGQVLLARELVDDPLVELPALRRQRDHPVLGQAAVDALERRRDDVHPQDHARAAAVRLVVHLAARRPVPVVEEAQVELAAEDGGDGALFGDGSEDMGYEREDVEAQGLSRLVISRRKTGRHQDSAPVEVDLSDTGLDEREQDSRVELQRVVGRARDDVGDDTELPAPLLLHLAGRRAGRRSTRPAAAVGQVGTGTSSRVPRGTGRSSRITRRPPACLRSSTRTSSPPARRTAPGSKRFGSSLACSTTKEPSRPCGLPTRPT